MKHLTMIIASVLAVDAALGACLPSPEERKTITVETCEVIVPSRLPQVSRMIENADDFNKDLLQTSYTGILLETADAKYFVNADLARSCSAFPEGEPVEVMIEKACCDGDPNAPCLLGISEYISDYGSRRR
jgi:hypothetical protein